MKRIISNTIPKFRIQYVSDLHLEWNKVAPEKIITPVAPYLAITGDLAPPTHPSTRSFLSFVSTAFERVFYVPGNHEYDGFSQKAECDAALTDLCGQFSNVELLNSRSYVFRDKNVAIVGAPLWSPAFTFLNRPVMTADIRAATQVEKQVLTDEIGYFAGRGSQVVVLSHFLPSSRLVLEKYANYPNKHRFYHACDELLKAPVCAWIYGHSHTASRHFLNGVACCINPYGYPNEGRRGATGFCDRMFVEFPLQTEAEEDAKPPRPYSIFKI